MAGGITGALTQKYGPLPGWAWAGVAAAGAWLLLPRLRGAAGTTSSTTSASGPSSDSVYGLGYAQGLQAAGPAASANPVGAIASAVQSMVTLKGRPGYRTDASGRAIIGIWRIPGTSGGEVTELTEGTSLQSAGQPVEGELYSNSKFWQPVRLSDGSVGYVWAPDTIVATQSTTGGVGGPGAMGSRSADLMSPWHPLVTAHHSYPHFVRAVGGAPNHSREVVRVAQQAGVHPARLMMLNPDPTGWVRVA